MKVLKTIVVMILITGLQVPFQCVHPVSAVGFPFSIEPSYPENQIEPNNGYFYLDTFSGQEQSLSIKIRNTDSQTHTIFIETADAYTAPTGDLTYISDNKSPLVSLTDDHFLLSDNIFLPYSSLTLKAKEETTFKFRVVAPTLSEGEVLGAIRFFILQGGGGRPSADGTQFNVAIKNAVTLVVRLKYRDPGRLPKPAVLIGEAGFASGTRMLYVVMENTLPMINREASGKITLLDQQGTTLVAQNFDLVKMAPKSQVHMPIPYAGPRIEAGKLTVKVMFNEAGSTPETREIQLTQDIEIIQETTPPAAVPEKPNVAADDMLLLYGGWIMFMITAVFFIIFMAVWRKKARHNNRAD